MSKIEELNEDLLALRRTLKDLGLSDLRVDREIEKQKRWRKGVRKKFGKLDSMRRRKKMTIINSIIQYIKNFLEVHGQLTMALLYQYNPKYKKSYIHNLLYVLDQYANAVFLLGDPQETISSRFGKVIFGLSQASPNSFLYKVAMFVCKLLHPFDKNHCFKAINNKEGDDELEYEFQRLVFSLGVIALVVWYFY